MPATALSRTALDPLDAIELEYLKELNEARVGEIRADDVKADVGFTVVSVVAAAIVGVATSPLGARLTSPPGLALYASASVFVFAMVCFAAALVPRDGMWRRLVRSALRRGDRALSIHKAGDAVRFTNAGFKAELRRVAHDDEARIEDHKALARIAVAKNRWLRVGYTATVIGGVTLLVAIAVH
jgi:hypothetical protein